MRIIDLYNRKIDKLDEIVDLTINERQCIAIDCFNRYCNYNKIWHSEIEKFSSHIWKIAYLSTGNFNNWVDGFKELVITGQGDPLTEELINVITNKLLPEFNLLTTYVYETSASCWYGAENLESNKMLIKIFEILEKNDIKIPKIEEFKFSKLKSKDGWSKEVDEKKLGEVESKRVKLKEVNKNIIR